MTKAWLLPVALACATAGINQQVSAAAYSEDFDDGQAQGWTLDGLWKLTENNPNGTTALGYVQDETPGTTLNGNYDTGVANFASASTPQLSCDDNCVLSFDWLDDSEEGEIFDRFDVFIDTADTTFRILSSGNFNNTQTYRQFTSAGDSTINALFDSAEAFSVRFFFDTIDANFNSAPGVRVDNFRLTDGGTGGPSPGGPDGGTGGPLPGGPDGTTEVPLPGGAVLFGAGLAALGRAGRRRR
jgi:hypothetical protein